MSARWVPRQPVFKTSECYRCGVRYDTGKAVEQRHKDACSHAEGIILWMEGSP